MALLRAVSPAKTSHVGSDPASELR